MWNETKQEILGRPQGPSQLFSPENDAKRSVVGVVVVVWVFLVVLVWFGFLTPLIYRIWTITWKL